MDVDQIVRTAAVTVTVLCAAGSVYFAWKSSRSRRTAEEALRRRYTP